MAITYAWRLDANKYAYIIDPKGEYGYASTAPLSGDELATVAKTSNEWFGEGGKKGFSGYVEAFHAMQGKIKKTWPDEGTQYYDLLSADVYYNVDASTCADLKGVGIRGIRYLGVCDRNTWDPDNPSWNPQAKQTEWQQIQGKFSVYGIYMEDQYDDDGKLSSNPPPENIFAVYNGADAKAADGGDSTATLTAKLDAEIIRSTNEDTNLGAQIAYLTTRVDNLAGLGGTNLGNIVEQVTLLYQHCITGDITNALITRVSELEGQVVALQRAIEDIRDKNTAGNNGGGNASISYDELNEGEYGLVVSSLSSNKLYFVNDVFVSVENEGKTISLRAPSFYQNNKNGQ